MHGFIDGCEKHPFDKENETLFFYTPQQQNDRESSNRPYGKDINSLRIEAVQGLTTMVNSFINKADQHQPASDTIRANKVDMYLSRIDQPFKKCNNDKAVVKLQNHANALFTLGNDWLRNHVHIELFMIDITNHQSISYIEKSKDYLQFPRANHKIITKSMIFKLNNYLKNNQRFKVDKKNSRQKWMFYPNPYIYPTIGACV